MHENSGAASRNCTCDENTRPDTNRVHYYSAIAAKWMRVADLHRTGPLYESGDSLV